MPCGPCCRRQLCGRDQLPCRRIVVLVEPCPARAAVRAGLVTPLSRRRPGVDGFATVIPSKSRHGSATENTAEQAAGDMLHGLLRRCFEKTSRSSRRPLWSQGATRTSGTGSGARPARLFRHWAHDSKHRHHKREWGMEEHMNHEWSRGAHASSEFVRAYWSCRVNRRPLADRCGGGVGTLQPFSTRLHVNTNLDERACRLFR